MDATYETRMGKYVENPQRSGEIGPTRGVTKHRNTLRYEAHIWHQGKQFYLGSYDCQKHAAQAYDKMAVYLGKNTDRLNYSKTLPHIQRSGNQAATPQQFLAKIRKESCGFARGASKFRGVSIRGPNQKWEARIGSLLGKSYTYLGTFHTGEDAARAYDVAAVLSRGKAALTNHDIQDYQVLVDRVDHATKELKRSLQEHFVRNIKVNWGGDHQEGSSFWMRAIHNLAAYMLPTDTLHLTTDNHLEARRSAHFKLCPEGFVALHPANGSVADSRGGIPTISCSRITQFLRARKRRVQTAGRELTRTHRLRIYPRENQSVHERRKMEESPGAFHLDNTDNSWSTEPAFGLKVVEEKEHTHPTCLDPTMLLANDQMDPALQKIASVLKSDNIVTQGSQISSIQAYPKDPPKGCLEKPSNSLPFLWNISSVDGYVDGQLMHMH